VRISLLNLHQRQSGGKPTLFVELLGRDFGAETNVMVDVKFVIDRGAATQEGKSVTLTPDGPVGASCAGSDLTGLHQVQAKALVGGSEVAGTLVVTLDFDKGISPPDATELGVH
jgi:hypothetical protein